MFGPKYFRVFFRRLRFDPKSHLCMHNLIEIYITLIPICFQKMFAFGDINLNVWTEWFLAQQCLANKENITIANLNY